MKFFREKIQFEIIFWSIYFLYEWIGNATVASEYKRYFINAAVTVPITFVASLFTVKVLLKQFYFKEKKQFFWIGLFSSMIVFSLLRRAFNYYYTYALYFPEGQTTMPYLFLPKLIIESVSIYLIVSLYAMFYFVKAWYEQQRVSQALEQDKTKVELELLKSQVHPHFIFNTLNNIYSLSLQNNSKTPDLIFRLSSFLNYNLYNGKLNAIPVEKELEYIYNYIELEKIRYNNEVDISLNIYDKLEGFSISPLLLLPLVENCFKHGIGQSSYTSWIRIDLSRQDDWLLLKIENSNTNLNGTEQKNRVGIGQQNVKRRLEILYPGRHELNFIDEEDSYLVVLKLKNYA